METGARPSRIFLGLRLGSPQPVGYQFEETNPKTKN
jgi:hypothetical protein